ncbi:hypothetical protein SSX86_022586 [Deinandra increscens subsp. villosa]|uniref:Reverse transcriptase domain-containing protein n=1 Tax=Deinandra increscens subsp. villosa TaxID=3103831 RepID=A0AAP0GP77_9ASTR
MWPNIAAAAATAVSLVVVTEFEPLWYESFAGMFRLLLQGRYEIMRNYMPKVGSLGLDMMFRTCTVQVFARWPEASVMALPRRASDHNPILLKLANDDFGPIPFKFYSSWLKHPEIEEIVQRSVGGFVGEAGDKADRRLLLKMKKLKEDLRCWRLKVSQDVNATKNEALEICKRFEDLASLFPLDEQEILQWEEAKNTLNRIEEERVDDLKQKSRVKWAVDGDANTSFFHGWINKNISASRLNGVMVDNNWISDPTAVKKAVFKFFSHKFKKTDQWRPSFLCEGIRKLSESDKEGLVASFSKMEIKKAVWDCGSDKAPGPDGFTFAFLKKFWNLFEDDFWDIFQEFYSDGVVGKGCGAAFIHLIAKVKDPRCLSDFRPISLVGLIPKVISKVLANRVKGPLGNIISEPQMAFLAGRNILDGVLIANEVVSWVKKSRLPSLIFKIDFEKAFDTVDWDFLDSMLEQMEFPRRWRSWVRGCLGATRTSVLVNGSPTWEFKCERGVRQGDPLSPFLFLIAMEGLHWMMERACLGNIFRGIHLPNGGPCISHLLFADDALVMGQWGDDNIANLVQILRIFGLVSGLNINIKKCALFGLNVDSEAVSDKAGLFRCDKGILPFKYLGLLVGANMNRISSWEDATKAIQDRLSSEPNRLWKRVISSIHSRPNNSLGPVPVRREIGGVWANIVKVCDGLKEDGVDVCGLIQVSSGNVKWLGDDQGVFSMAGVRRLLNWYPRSDALIMPWNRLVPNKVNILFWRILKDKIATKEALARRKVDTGDPWCPLCLEEEETVMHLMHGCKMAAGLWDLIASWCRVPPIYAFDFQDFLKLVEDSRFDRKAKMVFFAVILTTCWVIWTARNKSIFDGAKTCLSVLFNDVKYDKENTVTNGDAAEPKFGKKKKRALEEETKPAENGKENGTRAENGIDKKKKKKSKDVEMEDVAAVSDGKKKKKVIRVKKEEEDDKVSVWDSFSLFAFGLHSGEPQLQSTGGTKVEIDPHLTVAQDMANWFNQAEMGGTENRSSVPKLRIAEKMSEKDRVTIGHLRQQDNRTLKEGVYTVEATITSFTEGRLWFYVTCTTCNSRVYEDNMTYSCEKHKQQHLRYSYSVNCDIEDHTGTANVTIFDKGMLAMLETNCYNMYTDNSDAGSKTLPPPIEAQRSAKWIFQLKNGERFGNDSIKFTVNNVFQAAVPTPLALTAAGTSGESKLCITEGDKKPVCRQLFVEGETDVEGKQQISVDAEQENTDYIGKVTDLEEKQIGDRSPVLMMTLQEPGARAVVMKLSESIYNEINLENITTMDREVIVAATALKVVPAPGSLGLLCTPATTVSVNPGIPIAKNMAKEFRAQRNDAPVERLAVRAVYQPYQDRTTFATYISSFYRGHRSLREGDSYTLAAMITAISETEPWFHGSCIACPSASRVQHTGVVFSCQEHGDKYVYYRYGS